jgi:hypothetical protein
MYENVANAEINLKSIKKRQMLISYKKENEMEPSIAIKGIQ